MSDAVLTNALYSVLYYAAVFTVPPLLVATAAAFAVGLFQAVTQIQEQTLPQTIKIFAIGAVMLFMGSILAGPLFSVSNDLFSRFHTYESR
ncbi:MAG: flagellar biosynthetic protein FliQ [Pseudomonadota bacterium]